MRSKYVKHHVLGKNDILTLMIPQKQESYVRCSLFLMIIKIFVLGTWCIVKNPPSTMETPDISTCQVEMPMNSKIEIKGKKYTIKNSKI